MTWVRSPLFDCFWLLSGLPIGIVLMLFSPGFVTPLVIMIMILETGHLVSPILLAWTHPELRAIVSQEWVKHVACPAGVMCAVLVAPVPWVMGIYYAWNIYHFGMQNFGVLSLYGVIRDRAMRGVICLAVTALGMGVVPLLVHDMRVTMLMTGIFSFNHWLTDVGLSSLVVRWRWGFVAVVLMVGIVWLLLRNGPLSTQVVPQIIVLRAGLGMVHFIYSARVWRLSDPPIRAAMGRLAA